MTESKKTTYLDTTFYVTQKAENGGDWQCAISACRAVVAEQPDNAAAHYRLAINLLRVGDYRNGWREYEWRWITPGFSAPLREFGRPLWSGAANPRERVLLHAEQGFGDTIQFLRFVPLVRKLVGQVELIVPPELYRLAQSAPGIDRVLQNGDPWPEFDSHAPLMSLPYLLGITSVAAVPASAPYLSADSGALARWQKLLEPWNGLKIGLAWQGRPEHENNLRRSYALANFQPLLSIEHATYFNLQPKALQGVAAPEAAKIVDLTEAIVDFADTAALISQLDLVIAVDTSVAHLAGALGKPVWVLLPFPADWRWMTEGAETIWYPAMRLFRQTLGENQAIQMNRLQRELQQFTGAGSTADSLLPASCAPRVSLAAESGPVLLDGVFFQYRNTGIARVWRSILEVVSRTTVKDSFVLLDRAGSFPRISGFRYLALPAHDETGYEGERAMLQQVCNREGARAFVSTWHTSPVTTPALLMLHDMIPELMIPAEEFNATPRWQEKVAAIRQAAAYLAVSRTTAADFHRFYPDCSGRPLQVMPNGVSSSFQSRRGQAGSFAEKYAVSGGYWLFVGPRQSYKNFGLLLDAWLLLPPEDRLPILAAGYPLLEAEFVRHPAASAVVCTGHLDDDALMAAYSGAAALIYPSRYEGFGLPLLEAMACGCPVICSNASALVETAGNAAMAVPDNDPERLAAAMLLFLRNEVMRERYMLRGLKRAALCTWERSAAKLLEALKAL